MLNGKKGYRFTGWYIDPECTKRINPGGILFGPTCLYPRWDPIEYPVKYLLNSGENSKYNPTRVNARTGVQKLYPAHKEGSFFAGWYWKNQRMEFLPEGLTEMVILEARFTEIPEITFETGRGGNITKRQVDARGFLEPFIPPRRIGYEFGGWFMDRKFTIPFDFKKPLQKSCVLHAKWDLIKFDIDLDMDGGWVREPLKEFYTYESKTLLLPVPKKPGYDFQGWFDDNGRRWRLISSHSLGNVSLKARWRDMVPEVHGSWNDLTSVEDGSFY